MKTCTNCGENKASFCNRCVQLMVKASLSQKKAPETCEKCGAKYHSWRWCVENSPYKDLALKAPENAGCGKEVNTDQAVFICGGKCDSCKENHLCENCKNAGNHSPDATSLEDTPEVNSNEVRATSGTNASEVCVCGHVIGGHNHKTTSRGKPIKNIRYGYCTRRGCLCKLFKQMKGGMKNGK